MLKHLTPTLLRRLLLPVLAIALSVLPAAAQRLGGLPDEAFHPADSGLAVPSLNRKNQIFYPGPEGGLYMSTYTAPSKYGMRGRHSYQYTSYYGADNRSRYYNTNSYISDQSGFFMSTHKGLHFIAQEGLGGYQQYTDSIRVVPYRPSTASQSGRSSPRPRAFQFNQPFRGYPNLGIAQTTPSQLAFFITHNPLDTAAPHTTTYVRLVDTAGNPLARQQILSNFRAEAISEANGRLYLLGHDMIDTLPGATRMVVLISSSLAQTGSPAFLESNLLGAAPQVFKALPDGKFLLAGNLFSTPLGGYYGMATRLMPNGQPDPSWANSYASGGYAIWYLDSTNIFRSASINTTGLGGTAALTVYRANGGTASGVNVPIDPSYPGVRPLCYQPDQNSFLFETENLSPDYPPAYWTGWLTDSGYGTRHRFYVGFNRKTWPLVNHHGVGMYGDYFRFNTNPANTKLLAFGYFTQVNRELRPSIAVLNPDGTTDTTFKAVHKMDEPLRSQLLNYGLSEARLTNSGKVVFNYPNGSNYGYFSVSDSSYRLAANGSVDYSYTRIWAPGTMVKGKRGTYTTLRSYTQAGVPTYLGAFEGDIELRLAETDAEGNFIREYGSFKPTGFPDTMITAARRWRDTYTTDEAGGVWVQQGWVQPIPGTNPQEWVNRQYYVRFDSTGRSRIIYPNFSMHEKPMKIEILAGKRMRLTGIFNIPNGTLAGSYYNIIETDSLGILDTSIPPFRYYTPDSYGTRTTQFVVPRRILADGKILTVQANNTYSYNLVTRHFPDGRQDPSFLPITMAIVQTDNLEVIGDRLFLGGENYGWVFRPGGRRNSWIYGGAAKNGIYGFRISSIPGTVGYVQGRVQQVVSPATGCTPAGPRRPATGMLLRAQPTDRLAIADTGGYYFMALDTGRHVVAQRIANNFLQRQVCPPAAGAGQAAPGRAIHLPQAGTTLVAQDFLNQTFDCPRLEVTVLQPRFRLCSRSAIRLQYQNDGMADEPAARIRLNLPQEIRIERSTHAYTRGGDSSYVFDLGRLAPGAHGEIVLHDSILCPLQPDSMARACYSARIEPLSLCSRIDASTLNWDGAWIDAEARYLQARNVVRLVIRNRGGQMADSTPMRLVNPVSATYFDGKIKIAAGDSLVVELPPAIQGSISLFVRQTPNCPLGSYSALFHAGRGTARTFLNFGSGLLESYTVHGCPSFRFSFDPNEKVVQPEGDIEPGTELAYTIHFENFGNDTAYSVIVEDSLPAGLDVTTLKITGSSTPCTLVMEGTEAQPVAYFHFKPIKLTGKKQDSVRSKGQVGFTIRARANVVRGSVISNRANIYFDRNPAVVTEYVHSPIANPQPLGTKPKQLVAEGLTLYPNPSQGSVEIRLNGKELSPGMRLTVTTLQGQVLRNQPLPTSGSIQLQGLPPGIYLVKAGSYKAQTLVIVR